MTSAHTPVIVMTCLLAAASAVAPPLSADKPAEGGCIAYGDDYAFALAQPKGWVLSCKESEHSDVPVALWPTGFTWENAKVVMYVNPSQKDSPPQTLEDFVKFSASQFRKDKPGVTITPGAVLQTADHSRVLVQHFTGDQWGNHEAVAYIESKTIFAIVVLSARTEPDYKASYAAFEKLVSSYMFMKKVDAKVDSGNGKAPIDLTKAKQGSCQNGQLESDRGCVKPGKRTKQVPPEYPKPARLKGENGSVSLAVTLDEAGRVVDVTVSGSLPKNMGFEEAAIAAVRQWQYQPALLAEKAVAIVLAVKVDFSISR